METISKSPEKKIYLSKLGLTILLFCLELLISIIIAVFTLNDDLKSYKPPFDLQIYQTAFWLIGKVIPLIIIIIVFRKYFIECFKKTKINIKGFFIYLVISFLVFYLFELATSYYQLLMNKLFNIGEATNQEAIKSYFKNDTSSLNYILLFITIVIVAPIVEEMEFRKLVFDAFSDKVHFIVPTLVSGFMFGLIHLALSDITLIELSYFPIYFLPGVALALIYYFSGKNIYTNILVHSIMNLISYFVLISQI